MKISIELPSNMSKESLMQKINEIEASFTEDAKNTKIIEAKTVEPSPSIDPWTNPAIDLPSVDTEIEDLSINHDHYLYGVKKKI